MDIKSIRKALGLSQADLAARLGLTQGTVSRFENGVLPVDERTKLAVEALRMKAAA
ncbi:MAG TPA: helix-turn-helix transcriptional regulator [Sphingomicrobium sp.]|jgi:transcriptional regulator with XRE-family HTH domain